MLGVRRDGREGNEGLEDDGRPLVPEVRVVGVSGAITHRDIIELYEHLYDKALAEAIAFDTDGRNGHRASRAESLRTAYETQLYLRDAPEQKRNVAAHREAVLAARRRREP